MRSFNLLLDKPRKQIVKIYFLIDTSDSMKGDKIATVYYSIGNLISKLRYEADCRTDLEVILRVMIFSNVARWHTVERKINDFQWFDLSCGGRGRSMGAAFKLLAIENLLEKDVILSFHPQTVFLFTSGVSTDNFDNGLIPFLGTELGRRAIRIAIPMDNDFNVSELEKFTLTKEWIVYPDSLHLLSSLTPLDDEYQRLCGNCGKLTLNYCVCECIISRP